MSLPADLVKELGWKKNTYVYVQKTKSKSLILRAVPDVVVTAQDR